MKKIICIVILLLSMDFSTYAQDAYPQVEVKVSSDKVKVGGRLYYSHVVLEKQTLYSISRAYGVEVIEIIEANPKLHLSTSPIRTGDVLFIPIVNRPVIEIADDAEENVAPIDTDNSLAPSESLLESVTDSLTAEKIDFAGKKVNLSLLLPFDVDTTANKNYLNFYFGALLAVKELADKGMQIEVNAVDISGEDALALNRRTLKESDLIVGPVSGYDITRTLSVTPKDKYIISPLDPRTESLTENSRVILAGTPARVQIEDMISWIQEDMVEEPDTLASLSHTDSLTTISHHHDSAHLTPLVDSLIVVSETGYKRTSTQDMMEEMLSVIPDRRKIAVDYSLSGGLEMNEWFGIHTHLKDTLTRVVIASEHDIFVKDAIRNVSLQKNMQKNVVLYGPAKTKSAELEEMCDAFLHNSVTYHIDYYSSDVIRFIKDYRALYGGEPDSYSFHGYDTVKYFISAYAKYGEKWPEHLEEFTMNGLQTYFHFKKPSGYKGAVNEGIRRVVYSPGYKIEVFDK